MLTVEIRKLRPRQGDFWILSVDDVIWSIKHWEIVVKIYDFSPLINTSIVVYYLNDWKYANESHEMN